MSRQDFFFQNRSFKFDSKINILYSQLAEWFFKSAALCDVLIAFK